MSLILHLSQKFEKRKETRNKIKIFIWSTKLKNHLNLYLRINIRLLQTILSLQIILIPPG